MHSWMKAKDFKFIHIRDQFEVRNGHNRAYSIKITEIETEKPK
jgi:hypothetical protein